MDLGLFLKQLRLQRGFSARDASRLIGVSVGYVSNIENNYDDPSADVLVRLAALYRAEPAALLQCALEQQLAKFKQELDTEHAELLKHWTASEQRERLSQQEPRQAIFKLMYVAPAPRRRRRSA